jgi:membrane-bound lytic murein transglycosylase D
MMLKIAKEEDVPPELVFLSMIESRLNANAVSRASAVGLWQFIRSTGQLYGLNDNSSIWIDERRDPEKSTRAAMRHLKDLYIELGHWHLALAAYNCGVGRVRKALAKSEVQNPTYWDIRKLLPRETRYYVPFYIATTKFSLNPEYYGFDPETIQPAEEYLYDTVVIYEPANFDAIAKCANSTEDEIRDLNPELIKHCTPPDARSYILKIPVGKKDAFVDNFSKMSPEEKMPWIFHLVQRGETLLKIAKKYDVSSREIASLNDLKSYKARVNKGDILKIPIDKSSFIASNSNNDSDEKSKNYEEQSSEINIKEKPGKTIKHVVKKGENLYKIAQIYGVRLTDLRNYNNIPYNSDNISVGDELIISTSEESLSESEPVISKIEKPTIVKHKVRRGETLAQIADDYGTTIEDIQQYNRLKRNKIYIGQILKINTTENNKSTSETNRKIVDNTGKLKITHKVRKGETISTIAGRYGVTESELRKWNPHAIDGSTIYSGDYLTVYTNRTAKGGYTSTAKKVNKPPKYYKIKYGDTLGKIAQKFGISVAQLKSKNKNINEKRLIVGQKIRLQ